MLLAIKDRINGILGIVVIIIITIPFALWGIQSYLGGGKETYVATVNDSEISMQEFERVLSTERQSLLKQYNGKLPFNESLLKSLVLDQLVNRRLLEDRSIDGGYKISDSALNARITSSNGFMEDGKFSNELYRAILAANNSSPKQYEESLRLDMRVQQLRNSLKESEFVTESSARFIAGLNQQKRAFSYIAFNSKNTPSDKPITDQDLRDYYDANKDLFMSEEKIKIQYIELDNKGLAEEITVEESRVREMYDAYLAQMAKDEERKARHILITAKNDEEIKHARTQLEDIRKQILNGASFEELAKQHSNDPGSADQGGDLGWVSRDEMVKPFEDALYALKKGQISDIVASKFGLHLIKLDDVRSKEPESYDKKRDEFVKILKADSVDSKFYDLTDNLAALAYENPDSLDVPADQLDLAVKMTDYFTRQQGKGIAQNPKVRAAAFSENVLEGGENSDMIKLSDGHVMVLRVIERNPAKLIPFEDTRERIRTIIEDENARDVILKAAQETKQKIMDGAPLSSLAKGDLKVVDTGLVARNEIKKADYRLLETGFKMVESEPGKPSVEVISLLSGDTAVVVLDKIETPATSDEQVLTDARQMLRDEKSLQLFNAYLDSLADIAEVVKNTKALQQ